MHTEYLRQWQLLAALPAGHGRGSACQAIMLEERLDAPWRRDRIIEE
jgi:hypothetical protein